MQIIHTYDKTSNNMQINNRKKLNNMYINNGKQLKSMYIKLNFKSMLSKNRRKKLITLKETCKKQLFKNEIAFK